MKINAYENIADANVAIIIYDASGYRLIDANTALQNQYISLLAGEEATIRIQLNEILLKPGQYMVGLWIGRSNIEDIDGIQYANSFTVDINPENIQHSQIFPGPYQCKFSVQEYKN